MRIFLLGLALATVAAQAQAAPLKRVATIAVPGEPLESFDISFVDPATNRYYLADRSNKALDVYDVEAGKLLARVGGFVGYHGSNDTAGPNGVVVMGHEAWVTDGDSTVKVVDLDTGKITDTIGTGGKARVDEVAYDPRDHVFIGGNNADDPPFVTLISTELGHRVIGKITFDRATDGLEQSVYVASVGRFYLSLPQLDHDEHLGGVAVIDPVHAIVEKILPVADCAPAGLAQGPGTHLVLGCNAGGKESKLAPRISVLDTATGTVVGSVSQVGAADQVAYDPHANQYYIAARQMPGGAVLGVIDAGSDTWVENVKTSQNAHSVAVAADGRVLVPLAKTGGDCGGCIGVYAPQ